jgi:hypothetical protein
MALVELAGACSPKTFPWVVKIPNVQITDLRALRGGQTAHMTSRNLPSFGRTDRDDELVKKNTLASNTLGLAGVGDSVVELAVNVKRRVLRSGKVSRGGDLALVSGLLLGMINRHDDDDDAWWFLLKG